jgi:xanthine/uracil permease
MKYQLDQKVPFSVALLYGLQWWIVSLPCVIIIGAVISKIHYNDIALQTMYMQKIFAVMGITTIIQVLWGHRLPLVIGPASVLLIGVLASLSAGISAIYTAVIIGGVFISVLAFSGLLTRLRFIFTPRIVTVILILIPFTLMPTIIKLIFGNQHHTFFNLLYTFILVISLLLLNNWLRGIWKSTTIIWGLIVGSIVYYAINGLPVIESVGYSKQISQEGFFIDLKFDIGTIIAFIFCFIALLVNELGSIEAIGQMLKVDNAGKRIKYGVGISGLSNILSGSIGTVGSVDYSMSTGVISATGCASRYTLIPAGIGLIACAFLPQFVNILNHIPSIVMGTLLIYLMSTQLSSGFTMLIKEKAVNRFEDGIIVGLPLMVAILISFTPTTAIDQMPDIIKPIVGNGFVMGVIMVLILEHIIFKKRTALRR